MEILNGICEVKVFSLLSKSQTERKRELNVTITDPFSGKGIQRLEEDSTGRIDLSPLQRLNLLSTSLGCSLSESPNLGLEIVVKENDGLAVVAFHIDHEVIPVDKAKENGWEIDERLIEEVADEIGSYYPVPFIRTFTLPFVKSQVCFLLLVSKIGLAEIHKLCIYHDFSTDRPTENFCLRHERIFSGLLPCSSTDFEGIPFHPDEVKRLRGLIVKTYKILQKEVKTLSER